MKKKIAVSVRNLVEFSFRAEALSFDTFSQINPLEAIFAHQKVQKSRPAGYTRGYFEIGIKKTLYFNV